MHQVSLEVDLQLFHRYNEDVQQQMASSAFSRDCSSWYKNAQGKVINNWPLNVEAYRQATQFISNDYHQYHLHVQQEVV